jgi:hypothetical protein
LVRQCKADTGMGGCWKEVPEMAKYGVEVWHGFSVTREKDKFLVKMPFGENGQMFEFSKLFKIILLFFLF